MDVTVVENRVKDFVRTHPRRLKDKFRTFDTLRRGEVSIQQFNRICDGELSLMKLGNDDLGLLKEKYTKANGLINYEDFCKTLDEDDYELMGNISNEVNNNLINRLDNIENIGNYECIVDRLRKLQLKYGIRLYDTIANYDNLNCGYVKENQFRAALDVATKTNKFQLSHIEASCIVENNRRDGNHVYYKKLCNLIDGGYVNDLEKNPLFILIKREKESGLRNTLTGSEEDTLNEVLERIRILIKKKNISLHQYFKNYKTSQSFTGLITCNQFERCLSLLEVLPLDGKEFELLVKKYQKEEDHIYYPKFIEDVEEGWILKKDNDENDEQTNFNDPKIVKKLNYFQYPNLPDKDTILTPSDTVLKLGKFEREKFIRLKDLFLDIDHLRKGTLTEHRLLNVLESIGVFDKTNSVFLTKNELSNFLDYYRSKDKKLINTQRLLTDLKRYDEEMTCEEKELNKIDILNPSADEDVTLRRWKSIIEIRRVDTRSVFLDFDKHNNGHINLNQYKQCLSTLRLNGTPEEIEKIGNRFLGTKGFNYLKFLDILDPTESDKYKDLHEQMKALQIAKQTPVAEKLTDVCSIVNRIKNYVLRRRISLYEAIRDHDKHNHGRIPTVTFRRALAAIGINMTNHELSLLENYYNTSVHPESMEYKAFCEDIESAFSGTDFDGLEKNPLLTPKKWEVREDVKFHKLSSEAENLVKHAMQKVAEKTRRYRIALFPCFEDFDRMKNGFVSPSQFGRVLSILNLAQSLTELEIELLAKKFSANIGPDNVGSNYQVNYLSFCNSVYVIADEARNNLVIHQ
ncbi:hypothetical protein SNEBB_003765 [Seison nebaliae]|nr:hypothetical protein SNEBB_003765 [Seison nebaliae]